jgi:hypothetical protein
MKKLIPYLYVLFPLVVLSLYQTFVQSSDVSDPSSFDPKFDHSTISSEDIVYTIKSNRPSGLISNLNRQQLKKDSKRLVTPSQAVEFLDQYLLLAKNNSSSLFTGYAISVFDQFEPSLKSDPDVLLAYASLLEYSHKFDEALKTLDTVAENRNYQGIAGLRKFNIHMIKGDLENATQQCKQLNNNDQLLVYSLCRLWSEGMQGDARKSANKIKQLLAILQKSDPIRLWAHQLVLDLHLIDNNINNALETLASIYTSNTADLSSLIQMVDYLILLDAELKASEIINQYDTNNKLLVRRALVAQRLQEKNLAVDFDHSKKLAEKQINLLSSINETSKFTDIALWHAIVSKNVDLAEKYAQLNLEGYRRRNDILLLAYVSK